MEEKIYNLAEIKKGIKGRILSIDNCNQIIAATLIELGFHENAEIEVMHKGVFGKDPIAVRINDSIFALRSTEARLVTVAVKSA